MFECQWSEVHHAIEHFTDQCAVHGGNHLCDDLLGGVRRTVLVRLLDSRGRHGGISRELAFATPLAKVTELVELNQIHVRDRSLNAGQQVQPALRDFSLSPLRSLHGAGLNEICDCPPDPVLEDELTTVNGGRPVCFADLHPLGDNTHQ